MYLRRKKCDAGTVVSPDVRNRLADYYECGGDCLSIGGLPVYDDYAQAVSNHTVVIVDDGCLDPEKNPAFYTRNIKLLLCPAAAWEIDALTDFLRGNAMARHISYLFWPVSVAHFAELQRNLKSGGCHSWRLADAPAWEKASGNDTIFSEVLALVLEKF
jgi:hypothetical protein